MIRVDYKKATRRWTFFLGIFLFIEVFLLPINVVPYIVAEVILIWIFGEILINILST